MWLLEQTLPDVGHDLLVLSDLGWDAYERAKLGWKVNVLTFLPDFEEGLIYGVYLYIVGGQEIIDHVCTRLLVAVVKDIVFGVHGPLDLMYLVCAVGTVLSHDDGSFKLAVDEIGVVALQAVLD